MTLKIKALVFAVAASALAGCETASPAYQAAAASNAAGYSEAQIESNRFYVTYRAPNGANAQTLQDYALLRAADVTLEHNRDWFWVDRRNLDGQSRGSSGSSIGFGFGGASFGRHTAVGTSVGMSFPLGGGSGPSATAATLEIRFGDGPKPDDANAYDARATSTNLRSRLANK